MGSQHTHVVDLTQGLRLNLSVDPAGLGKKRCKRLLIRFDRLFYQPRLPNFGAGRGRDQLEHGAVGCLQMLDDRRHLIALGLGPLR